MVVPGEEKYSPCEAGEIAVVSSALPSSTEAGNNQSNEAHTESTQLCFFSLWFESSRVLLKKCFGNGTKIRFLRRRNFAT